MAETSVVKLHWLWSIWKLCSSRGVSIAVLESDGLCLFIALSICWMFHLSCSEIAIILTVCSCSFFSLQVPLDRFPLFLLDFSIKIGLFHHLCEFFLKMFYSDYITGTSISERGLTLKGDSRADPLPWLSYAAINLVIPFSSLAWVAIWSPASFRAMGIGCLFGINRILVLIIKGLPNLVCGIGNVFNYRQLFCTSHEKILYTALSLEIFESHMKESIYLHEILLYRCWKHLCFNLTCHRGLELSAGCFNMIHVTEMFDCFGLFLLFLFLWRRLVQSMMMLLGMRRNCISYLFVFGNLQNCSRKLVTASYQRLSNILKVS